MSNVHLLSHPRDARRAVGRRAFCKTGLFASAALLLKPASSALGATVPALSAGDQALVQFVMGYSSACFLQGGGVLGVLSGTPAPITYLVAEIGDPAGFANAWQTPPAASVYANGNVFSFYGADDRFMVVEHLFPADSRPGNRLWRRARASVSRTKHSCSPRRPRP